MRRRPQPNHRRGLLRAGIAVVVLLALLLATLLIVASLTAPAVHAPAPTPPIAPVVPQTPGKSSGTVTPGTIAPRATPQATVKKGGTSHDVSLGDIALSKVMPAFALRRVDLGRIAYFSQRGTAYHGSTLYVRMRVGAAPRNVGQADRFVRPVWSPDLSSLLYVKVATSNRFPGARWTLLRYDVGTGASTRMAQAVGVGLEPLGWRHGRVLYALLHASGTDTSVFAAGPRGNHFLSILTTQAVSAPSLSPDGRWIAYLSPADCIYCTLSLFDLDGFTTWYGPSGAPSKYDVAWNRAGTLLVVSLGSHLEAIDTATHRTTLFASPRGIPPVWSSPMRAELLPPGLRLIELATGRTFTARHLNNVQ